MAKRIAVVLLAALLATVAYAAGTREQAAEQSARQWLALVDAAKYGESWDAASAEFKAHVTRAQWQELVKNVREPLSGVNSRVLAVAQYARELPGVPDGDYVVIQYNTAFANKKNSVETITMQLEKNGDWKTAGYFIK